MFLYLGNPAAAFCGQFFRQRLVSAEIGLPDRQNSVLGFVAGANFLQSGARGGRQAILGYAFPVIEPSLETRTPPLASLIRPLCGLAPKFCSSSSKNPSIPFVSHGDNRCLSSQGRRFSHPIPWQSFEELVADSQSY